MISENKIRQIQKKFSDNPSKLPQIFDALGDNNRFNLFRLLLDHDDLCVTEIAEIIQVSVPAASQQLKQLEQAGLVEKERHGQMICYKVNKKNSEVKIIVKLVQGKRRIF